MPGGAAENSSRQRGRQSQAVGLIAGWQFSS